jgi:divinyl chlorophyllide a 8-vinyl-reductase
MCFFKSVSRQLDKVLAGKSYLAFGNGEITQCNPIAESDLVTFMIDCIHDTKRENTILNMGGTDFPLTHKQNAAIMADLVGREPRLFLVPLCIVVAIRMVLQWAATISGSEMLLVNAVEMAINVHYYASESMLTTAKANHSEL